MKVAKKISFLFMMLALSACGSVEKKALAPCQSREACLNDPDCACWCSQMCGWRKKTGDDHPIYIENDANGKFCYCKQWDYDHYQDNCVEHKDVKQPEGAQ